MPIPEFIRDLRAHVGTAPLWLIGVTAVVLKDRQVLLVRRSDNGRWSPVTGIVDPGEHPALTATREALEETGVEVTVEALVRVGVSEPVVHANGDRAQYLDHTFRCAYVSGEAHPADDESTEVGWFGLDDLPPMSRELRDRILVAVTHDGGPVKLS